MMQSKSITIEYPNNRYQLDTDKGQEKPGPSDCAFGEVPMALVNIVSHRLM